MQFAMPFTAPPLYFYFYYPNPHPFIPPTPLKEEVPEESQIPITTPEVQEQNQITVTREDLIQEGYQQSKTPWTEEEDELLMRLCSNPLAYFDEVAVHLPGRNSKMCYSRYRRLTNQSKKPWTKAQNDRLKNLVEEYGQSQWKKLETHFSGRTFKQLKDHYENFLQPSLSSKEWTIQEDLELIEMINKHGQRWKHLQSLMPHRSCSQLKNRFFGRIKRIHDKKMACTQASSSISLAY